MNHNPAQAAAAVFSLALLGCLSTAYAQEGQIHQTPVETRVISDFKIGSDQKLFGPLAFVGGLEMVSSQQHFGALSGLVLDDSQRQMVAVADTGFWLRATLERDAATNQLVGIRAGQMAEMKNADGQPLRDKWLADAEGIAVIQDMIVVSFERVHRVENHRYDPASGFYQLDSVRTLPVDLNELRNNRGFEGIDIAPATTPWPGALVGISEKSLDANGNIMGFVAPENEPSFEFSLSRSDGYDVTDLSFLPDGSLLVLERRFTIQSGVAMRIRHIETAAIHSDATVDASVWLEADMRYQIDNMEGMEVSTDPDGTPRITLISDDNHSILQRNLLLEFRLVGASGTQ